MKSIIFVFALALPIHISAFPPTMWPRPADITAWTNPLKTVWDSLTPYSGTVRTDRPKLPIRNGTRILCIGNSLSGWGAPIDENLPAVYRRLNPSGGTITCKLMGRGSAWLRDYIKETNLGILDSIRSARYDILVVQPWQDAMWPRSGSLDEVKSRNVDSLRSHFVRWCDSLYTECGKVGTQMVMWSPNGSQFDDRLVYMTYSDYNCRRIARRLNIPLALTVNAFDSCYLASDNTSMVWYDAVHESPEMSAMYGVLIYSMLMNGAPVSGMPANWLDVPGTQWATAYSTRTAFIRQDLLTAWSVKIAGYQTAFNGQSTATAGAPMRRLCESIARAGAAPHAVSLDGRRVSARPLTAAGARVGAGTPAGMGLQLRGPARNTVVSQ